ncbi:MAG TPA: hypothetical protein VFE19_00595 [Jatrophihabitantaceae bacterium]|nr:hypothetical protein [Jatrophihabitantaceae bacterium]
MNVKVLIGSATAVLALLGGTAAAHRPAPEARVPATHVPSGVSALRAATSKFHSIAVAEQHGYGLLTDAKGIACIDMPAMPGMRGGAMGVHWANSKLVGNPGIVAKRPEAMVYAPGPHGTLKLAAVEYVVLRKDWHATHKHRPRLYGHTFNLTPAPNRFGLPAFYSLHVWAWRHNSAGMFQMWNPKLSCPSS